MAAAAVALLACALGGVAVSAYLTVVHYAPVPLACTTSGIVDCGAVTRSSYSVVPGTDIPVTICGLGWFGVSGVLAAVAVARWRRGRAEPALLRPLHLAWSGAALGGVAYLLYAEVVRLHRLCEWCTAVHLLVAASFLLSLARWQAATAAE